MYNFLCLDSDMGDQGVVRTGISYAAALSGPADNTPVPEEAPSSGFDDIDLDDDSQGKLFLYRA